MEFAIIISMIIYVDYKCYVRGADAILFKDKTELEKDLRELQHLEVKRKIRDLERER